MNTPFKVGLVGLGTIARSQHLPALAKEPQIDLAAIASRNASVDGLPSFHDIDAMLEAAADIDAVSLCTPPQGRFAQAVAAIEAGKHVMLEKPPGASVSEVKALAEMAEAAGVTLFATWHSREAAVVEEARRHLSLSVIKRVEIIWREDVRHWHPGQEWIWQPGGLGVFDPGINALSILTRILPTPAHVISAMLEIPANKQSPIAARLELHTLNGVPISADFDWRQTGAQIWDIRVTMDNGDLLLSDGGATLHIDGIRKMSAQDEEYNRLYARFAQLMMARTSDVDLAPLQLVADAFLLGERKLVDDFHDG